MEFLDVFNAVAAAVGNPPANAPKATSYNDEPIDVGLDSLDMVMVVAVLTDAYKIPEDTRFDDLSRVTIGTLRDYVNTHKQQDPGSIAQVLEYA
jgi:acyl carrier protein